MQWYPMNTFATGDFRNPCTLHENISQIIPRVAHADVVKRNRSLPRETLNVSCALCLNFTCNAWLRRLKITQIVNEHVRVTSCLGNCRICSR